GGGFPNFAGIALFALVLAGHPLIAPAMGRPWPAAEVFGIAPDPTAVATLAVLAIAQGGARWLLMVIPRLWCVVTGVTLWTMESGEFLAAPLGALVAFGIALFRRPSQHNVQVHGGKR